MLRIGSRAQVMHGNAKMTGGGLTKKQLKYNKRGKIVSRKASRAAKKSNNLIKAGYITRKGHFGSFKRGGGNKSYITSLRNKMNIYYKLRDDYYKTKNKNEQGKIRKNIMTF